MLKVIDRKIKENQVYARLPPRRCKWKKSYIHIRNSEMRNKMLQVDPTFLTISFLV